jgi:hypothetical protein
MLPDAALTKLKSEIKITLIPTSLLKLKTFVRVKTGNVYATASYIQMICNLIH